MTSAVAIDLIDNLIGMVDDNQGNDYDTALHMAIKALKAQTDTDTVRGGKAISVLGDTIKNISPLSLAPPDDDELMNCDGCKWKDTFRSGFCAKCKRRYIEDYYEAQ